MNFYRQHIEKNRFMFNAVLHQYKGKPKYGLVKMKRNKEPEIHIMTYIQGKNTFIDEKMDSIQENQFLFLLKFGQDAVYVILTEEEDKKEIPV